VQWGNDGFDETSGSGVARFQDAIEGGLLGQSHSFWHTHLVIQ
jgi:hypothetical protein